MTTASGPPSVARAPDQLVWRGHVSRRLLVIVLIIHAIALGWLLSSWPRVRLMLFDFREVPSEAFMAQPPAALPPLDYTEDDPADLGRFRAIAEPLVATVATEGDKLRRLGDYIYSLRRGGMPPVERDVREGLSVILNSMQQGEPEGCSQMSVVLAAFWRSLGGHTRGIRWATVEGAVGHFAVELYSTTHGRWMYYDMNVNGYGADVQGVPLSIAALRPNLMTGEGLSLALNAVAHDWTVAEFEAFLRENPVEWYALNNNALYMEPNRRFGAFNRFYPWLVRLPYPFDRVVDNVVGQRDRRLVVDGRLRVAGLLTLTGGRLLVLYLMAIVMMCGAALWSARAATPRSWLGRP